MLCRLSFLGCLFVLCPAARGDQPFRFPEGKHGKGELKYRNGLPVLIAQGTPEEIGEQIGVLAVKPAAAKMKALVKDAIQKRVGPVGWPLLVKTCQASSRSSRRSTGRRSRLWPGGAASTRRYSLSPILSRT